MRQKLALTISAAAVCLVCAAGGAEHREITLVDAAGKKAVLFGAREKRPTLLFFLLPDCPIANKYAPEIGRICREYEKRLNTFVVYVDPDLTADEAAKHAKEFGYACRVLVDGRHRLVRRAGATISPEAALFDSRGRRLYLGRIDDTFYDLGRRRDEPTRRDLRLVLEALERGKPVRPQVTKAIGCFIPTVR